MPRTRPEKLPGKRPPPRQKHWKKPTLAGVLLCLLGVFLSGVASAQEAEEPAVTASGEKESKAPWRGSVFLYRNSFTVNSLDPGEELTYNPYYAMVFSFQPRWWFNDHIWVRAGLDVSTEVTESDVTTYSDESWVGDLTVAAGYKNIYTIPVAEIVLSADLVLRTPTSKASQARTLILGIGPGVRLSRSFDVLGGLSVGYNLRANPLLHRYTTGELESPSVGGCIGSTGGCDAFLNTGVRNSQFRLQQTFDVSLGILDWLSATVSYGLVIDWLYDAVDSDQTAEQPVEPQDRRYSSMFEVQLTFSPLSSLQIGLGYSTVSPQLAPDSTYYNPLYNRYSSIFIDLIVNVEGLVNQIGEAIN